MTGLAEAGSQRRSLIVERPFVCAMLGSFILMIFGVVNGYPVFFNDSRSYVRGPGVVIQMLTGMDLIKAWPASQPKSSTPSQTIHDPQPISEPNATGAKIKNNGFIANRSIYYGALALLGYVTSRFWLTIYLQAFAVASVVAILFARGLRTSSTVAYFAIIAGLAVATTVGPFIAYIMPDIFASVMIMAAGVVFFFSDGLRPFERLYLYALIAFAVLAHASHVVILAALTGVFLLWVLFKRANIRRNLANVVAATACVGVGLLGQFAFSEAVLKATGEPALVLPHITAHLIDMGPGYRFIEARCGSQPFAVCEFKDRLPLYWEDFLGNPDPKHGVFAVADMPTKHRLSQEQMRFAAAVFAYDPTGVVLGMAKDAASQIYRFSLDDLRVTPEAAANYADRYPAGIARGISKSRLAEDPGLLPTLSAIDLGILVASIIVIGLLAWRATIANRRTTIDSRLWLWSAFVISGLIVNAVVCGVLASPYDRFQARVVWLAPLVAAILILGVRTAKLNDAREDVDGPTTQLRGTE